MRTTVEKKAEHRRALRAIAARRGDEGISCVLAEAIEHCLGRELRHAYRREELSSLAGSLSAGDALNLRSVARSMRRSRR
jgi:hypothetical protein